MGAGLQFSVTVRSLRNTSVFDWWKGVCRVETFGYGGNYCAVLRYCCQIHYASNVDRM